MKFALRRKNVKDWQSYQFYAGITPGLKVAGIGFLISALLSFWFSHHALFWGFMISGFLGAMIIPASLEDSYKYHFAVYLDQSPLLVTVWLKPLKRGFPDYKINSYKQYYSGNRAYWLDTNGNEPIDGMTKRLDLAVARKKQKLEEQ